MISNYDRPVAYIAGRTSEGSSSPDGRSTIFIIDVGQDRPIALVRVPVPEPDEATPDLEWCRLELIRLIDEGRALQAVKDGTIELLPNDAGMYTLEDLIPQLMMAVSMPQGISLSFREHWKPATR